MKKFILFLSFILTACQVPAPVEPVPAPPLPSLPPITVSRPVLAWERGHPERAAWSAELRSQVLGALPQLKLASDWNSYCKGFQSKSTDQQVDAISAMAVAISLFESAYNPKSIYHEPPPLGVDSIGLFQLSYEDNMKWCPMSRAKSNLTDPLVNIDCAIPEMAVLIAKDGVVAMGGKGTARRGLARYWSVMWPTGHLSEIKRAVLALPFCQ